jgi:hypothetical protein
VSSRRLDLCGLLELLFELECSTELLSLELDGWAVWPAIRPYCILYLNGDAARTPFDLGRRLVDRLTLENLRSAFYYLPISAWHVLTARLLRKRPDFAVHINSSTRMDFVHGKEKSIFFDDILTELRRERFVILEELSARYTYSSRPFMRPDFFDKLLLLAQKFAYFDSKVERTIESLAMRIERILRTFLAARRVDMPPDFWPVIGMMLEKFEKTRRVFRRFYSLVEARIALLTCSFDRTGQVAGTIEAGTSVVEMQHGIIFPYHYGYIWPGACSKYHMPVPDYLLAHNDYSRALLVSPLDAHYAETPIMRAAISNPRPFWRNDQVLLAGSIRHERALEGPRSSNASARFRVLITSQPTVSEELSSFIGHVAESIRGRGLACELMVKLHPIETRPSQLALWKRLQEHHPDLVTILDADTKNLLQLIVEADLHASIASTCHFDAARLGVPTVVLEIINIDFRLVRFDDFGFWKVHDSTGFVAVLEEAIAASDKWREYAARISATSGRLLPSHSLRRTLSALESILARRNSAPTRQGPTRGAFPSTRPA